jgi:hypothetical protein
MRNFLKIIFIAVCLSVSTSGYAKDMLIDVNVLFAVPDAGSSDDFHTGKTLSVNYNYYFLQSITIIIFCHGWPPLPGYSLAKRLVRTPSLM